MSKLNRPAIEAATVALEQALPVVPFGYYIASCATPEGGCIGWHCFQHQNPNIDCSDPIGGHYRPTNWHYCDGGAPLTQAWQRGELPVLTNVDMGIE